MSTRMKVASGSIIVGILSLILKFIAYRLTGSTALYADAMETIVNVAASLATLFAVWFASKPADSNHPYGHDKAEYFAAVLVGVMIVFAAASIFYSAWQSYKLQEVMTYSATGLAVNALAGALNAVWGVLLLRTGRKHRSPALQADGKHLLTDVVTSVGVLLGVALTFFTGWLLLDPILAALVGLNVLWAGWEVMKESVSGLMDEAVSQDVQDLIRETIRDCGDGALEAHDLRTRHSGQSTFIDFHLVVPGAMSVEQAHEICDRIERGIAKTVPGAHITIHVEPEHKAKHSGIVVL